MNQEEERREQQEAARQEAARQEQLQQYKEWHLLKLQQEAREAADKACQQEAAEQPRHTKADKKLCRLEGYKTTITAEDSQQVRAARSEKNRANRSAQ